MIFSVVVPVNCRCVSCNALAPIRLTIDHNKNQTWEVVAIERPLGWVGGNESFAAFGYCKNCAARAPIPVDPPKIEVLAPKASTPMACEKCAERDSKPVPAPEKIGEVFLKAPTERPPAAIPSAPERQIPPPPMSATIIQGAAPSTIRTMSAPLAVNPASVRLVAPIQKLVQNRVSSSPSLPVTPSSRTTVQAGYNAPVSQVTSRQVINETPKRVEALPSAPIVSGLSAQTFTMHADSGPKPLRQILPEPNVKVSSNAITKKPVEKSFPNSTPAAKPVF